MMSTTKANVIKNILFLLVFAAFLLGAVVLYRCLTPEAENAAEEETTCSTAAEAGYIWETDPGYAADFTVYDVDGNEVRLSDYLGRPIVLNFWASWCGPCQSEIYDFQSVYETYGDEVQFLMVNLTDGSSETKESASAYVAEHELTFPVLYDLDGSAAKSYAIYSIPHTFFIDAEGRLVAQITGATVSSTLEEVIEQIR